MKSKDEVFEAGLTRYLEAQKKFLRAASVCILQMISKEGYATLGNVCDFLRTRFNIPEDIRDYRLKTVLSTAYQLGAFNGSRFVLRQGKGFVLRTV